MARRLPPNQLKLHPREQQRKEQVNDRLETKLQDEVKKAFEDLQNRFERSNPKSKKDAFRDWGQHYAETNFRAVGQDAAYTVPHCYIGKQDLQEMGKERNDKGTKGVGMFSHTQESQIRSDVASSRVINTFTFLSNERERRRKDSQATQYPFMVLSGARYEHILRWPEHLFEIYPDVARDAPDMAKGKTNEFECYYNKPIDDTAERGDIDLLIVDQCAHVIFVEVKATGLFQETSDPKRNPWNKSKEQLNDHKARFKKMFPEKEFEEIKVHCVFALPNMTLKEAERRYGIDLNKMKENDEHVLTEEDIVKERFYTAESDYNLQPVESWWIKNFPDENSRPILRLDLMNTIISRYIGTLSRPLGMSLAQQRSQIRTPCDAIELSATVFKSLCFYFKEQEKKESEHLMNELLICRKGDRYSRVHLKGPPGSCRTTMAIIKARHFLDVTSQANQQTHTSDHTHVIVTDMGRGSRGRSIGWHVYFAILESDLSYSGRVHYLPIDVNTPISADQFEAKVNEYNRGKAFQPKKLMFIIDEILPVRFWEDILQALDQGAYKMSHVWCTDGIVPQDLGSHEERFHTIQLRCITRIPPTVQKVLYHVDWCENKTQRYQPEEPETEDSKKSERITNVNTSVCWSTRGPIPVSIRHKDHGTDTPLTCDKCAKELAELLVQKLCLIDAPDGSASDNNTLLCSIVILFSIPLNSYKNRDNIHVEINKSVCEKYSKYVDGCPLVQGLKAEIPQRIEVLTQVGDGQDLEQEAFWNKIPVCWVDKFQGLVRDVVIYLPSEAPPLSPASGTSTSEKERENTEALIRKMPWPGTAADPEVEVEHTSPTPKTDPETQEATEGTAVPGTCSPETGQAEAKIKAQNSEVDRRLAHMYWSTEDIGRYTEWDQTNLMFAASRCTSQLILIVP